MANAFARKLRQEMTEAENRLWFRLRNRRTNGLKFRRQAPLGRYIADFACFEALLIVEADSGHHGGPRDHERDEYLMALGWRVMRFGNDDILAHTDDVCDAIVLEAQRRMGRS